MLTPILPMNKQRNFSVVLIFLMVLFFSCKLIPEKEILIKPSEIGIYADYSTEEMVILSSGKHNIPRNASLYTYSLEGVNIKDNILVLTKDGKEILCRVDYWYNLNSKAIRKLHVEVGYSFKERLILSKIRAVMRKICSEYDFVDIELSEMEKAFISELKSDKEFSEFVKTKSFKLKIELDKN